MQLFVNETYNETTLDGLSRIPCPACQQTLFTGVGRYNGMYISCSRCPFVIRFCERAEDVYRLINIEYRKHVFQNVKGIWEHKTPTSIINYDRPIKGTTTTRVIVEDLIDKVDKLTILE